MVDQDDRHNQTSDPTPSATKSAQPIQPNNVEAPKSDFSGPPISNQPEDNRAFHREITAQDLARRDDSLEDKIRRSDRWLIGLGVLSLVTSVAGVFASYLQWDAMNSSGEDTNRAIKNIAALAQSAQAQADAMSSELKEVRKQTAAIQRQAGASQAQADAARERYARRQRRLAQKVAPVPPLRPAATELPRAATGAPPAAPSAPPPAQARQAAIAAALERARQKRRGP